MGPAGAVVSAVLSLPLTMSTPQVSEFTSMQPKYPCLLFKLPVELRLLTRDFLDLDALIQLRRSGHAGLSFCPNSGQRAYFVALANMFGLKSSDVSTLASVLRTVSLAVRLSDKKNSGRFVEVVTDPNSSEDAFADLLTAGTLFSVLRPGTLSTLRLFADQFERAEAAFARTCVTYIIALLCVVSTNAMQALRPGRIRATFGPQSSIHLWAVAVSSRQ